MSEPVSDAVHALAVKVREVLCMTERYDREGAREVPLVDYWGEIEGLVEQALKLPTGALRNLGEPGACTDPDCYGCDTN